MKSVLVILGAGVDKNEEPSVAGKLRCDKAIEREEQYDFILCSSDRSWRKELNQHKLSEAQSMKNYLVKKGITKNKIILEEESKDTFSNAYYSRIILDKMKVKKFDVITSKFHMPKTQFLFDIVFPAKDYILNFIEAPDPPAEDRWFQLKKESEKLLIDFYKEHLFTTYGLQKGKMQDIKKFIEEINPAMTGKQDLFHQKLTTKVNERLKHIKQRNV